jgi:hypothetical protein
MTRWLARFLPSALTPVAFPRGADQRLEQVDVVIVVLALQHGGDALQPHAGVDRGRGRSTALILRHLLVLHEDEVPDLDEAVAILVRAAGRAAGIFAMIVEDLRARAAGPGIAHRPEIVAGGDADDAVVGRPAIFFQWPKASSSCDRR